MGGVAEAVFKMCIGNGFGFRFAEGLSAEALFGWDYGAFLLEVTEELPGLPVIGTVTDDGLFRRGEETLSLAELLDLYEGRLEEVYPCNIPSPDMPLDAFSCPAGRRAAPAVRCAKPRVLIPAFPGTNCEYDSAMAVRDAGAEPEILVINNLSAEGVARSVDRVAAAIRNAQMIFLPGGFSGGDEPDGSAKFITAFFRAGAVREAVTELLDRRDGLICGICNGFQALIKLGLVPYGRIIDTDESCPTLTFNRIGRHQSRIVRTRIASNRSPWLSLTEVGEIYSVPISHGEGRFLAEEALVRELAAKGQIATQYVDLDGRVSADVHFNPNGSLFGVEGITSPDGRVFGKMGHAERIGDGLYRNVPGRYDLRMFEAAVRYFK
jgi:phosphoribosylformylglycinamidine synthase